MEALSAVSLPVIRALSVGEEVRFRAMVEDHSSSLVRCAGFSSSEPTQIDDAGESPELCDRSPGRRFDLDGSRRVEADGDRPGLGGEGAQPIGVATSEHQAPTGRGEAPGERGSDFAVGFEDQDRRAPWTSAWLTRANLGPEDRVC